jgi:hypothetical protein
MSGERLAIANKLIANATPAFLGDDVSCQQLAAPESFDFECSIDKRLANGTLVDLEGVLLIMGAPLHSTNLPSAICHL